MCNHFFHLTRFFNIASKVVTFIKTTTMLTFAVSFGYKKNLPYIFNIFSRRYYNIMRGKFSNRIDPLRMQIELCFSLSLECYRSTGKLLYALGGYSRNARSVFSLLFPVSSTRIFLARCSSIVMYL